MENLKSKEKLSTREFLNKKYGSKKGDALYNKILKAMGRLSENKSESLA